MDIKLISHASVIINARDTRIWTDPWLISKAFNNSWALLTNPTMSQQDYDEIDYVWISHEHPDHFNVPTLLSLPVDFKERVTVLYQDKNSTKIFDALKKFGFKHFKSLANNQLTPLKEGLQVYCYQCHMGDSCLGVDDGETVLFNINDAELTDRDREKIAKKLKKIDILLNQFSLAGYLGYADYQHYLPKFAQAKIQHMLDDHNSFKAKVTIPFASFVYFCTQENKFMNDYVNTPRDVFNSFSKSDLTCHVVSHEQTYSYDQLYDSSQALVDYDQMFGNIEKLEYLAKPKIELEELNKQCTKYSQSLAEKYPSFVLRMVKPISVYLPDIQQVVIIDIYNKSLCCADNQKDFDLKMSSQALFFSFANTFGFETLAVSASFLCFKNYGNWKKLKIISILDNQEIYLKPKYLFRFKTLKYIYSRVLNGLIGQVYSKISKNTA